MSFVATSAPAGPAHELHRLAGDGTKIMEACARNLIPLRVELGGKSPQIVLQDAGLARAAAGSCRWAR